MSFLSNFRHVARPKLQIPKRKFSNLDLLQPPPIKIDDLSGQYDDLTAQKRKNLASLYRLVNLSGTDMGIYNHITYHTNKDEFLINPYGLLYHEVTASNLISINSEGDVLDQGTSNFGYNNAGFHIHGTIHKSNSKNKVVLHVHVPDIVCYGRLFFEDGCNEIKVYNSEDYKPISQEECLMGPIMTMPYNGIIVSEEQSVEVHNATKDFKGNIIIMKNHGVTILGRDVEEAFMYLTTLCLSAETRNKIDSCLNGTSSSKFMGIADEWVAQANSLVAADVSSSGPMSPGVLLYKAYMRKLDQAGYKTGYKYIESD